MAFDPFHVSVAIVTYVVLGGFIVFFGMFSLLIREKLYMGEAILAFLFGVIIGPYGANIFNPRHWGDGNTETVQAITLEVTRVVLAVGVFAIGVELPSKYMQKHYKSLLFLMGPVMAVGWVVCAGLIYALIPALNFLSSLAIAACLTPTDPILAAAVINGRYAEKHVPEHLRHLLSAESGCNDGAAFPFLFISLYLILDSTARQAVGEWFYITWAYEIILGIVLGSLIGYGFRHLMKFCESHELIDRHSYVAQYISLALLSNGITALLGSDDLLAAFFSGVAFAWDSHFNKQTADSVFSAVADLLFNVAIFIFIGAWMPFSSFSNEDTTITVWRLVLIGFLVLLLRRLPIMLLLYKWIPDVRTFREAVFSGHFGPMGVGAIFIATLALDKLPKPNNPPQNQMDLLALTIEPIIAFMVMCSILIHGLSIPFFNLGRRVTSLSLPRTLSLRGHHEPEWATQITKVTRPEDIVINRDNAPLPVSEPISEKEMEEGRVATTPESSSDVTRGAAEAEGAADTTEGVEIREWREGRHLVREYHPKGPGEEVRVEVIRDAFESSGSRNIEAVKATFQVAENAIRDEVYRYLSNLSGRNSLEKSRSRGSQELDRPAAAPTPTAAPPPPNQEAATEEMTPVNENDENEDWVDEPATDKSSTSSEGKQKSSTSSLRRRRVGRSTSIRRSASDVAKSKRRTSLDSPTTPVENTTPPALSRAASSAGFPRTDSVSSVKNGDRLGRLRLQESGTQTPSMVRSRDSSPSRNVRFAPELSRPPSRPDTPSNELESPQSPQAPHTHAHSHSHSYSHSHSHSTPSAYPTQRASALKPPLKQ